MQNITPELSSLLLRLEEHLLRPDIRSDARALEAILSDDFREVGAAGHVYDRDDIIRALTSEPYDDRIAITGFTVNIHTVDHRGNDVVMTSCLSTRSTPDGKRIRSARRTSVWMRCDDTWRMRFHQATMLD